MDRELTPEHHRTRRWSVAARVALLAVLIGALGWSGKRLLSPSVDLSDLLIETVERGPLEATVTASGTVVPRQQQTVSSPVGAPVRAVLVSLGDQVKRGAVILTRATAATTYRDGRKLTMQVRGTDAGYWQILDFTRRARGSGSRW